VRRKTTLRVHSQLLAELKRTAAAEGRPLAAVIEDALRESLARRRAQPERVPVELPTFRGGGIMPGVDVDGSAALLELMDQDRLRALREGSG
jgi:hypothetical protein